MNYQGGGRVRGEAQPDPISPISAQIRAAIRNLDILEIPQSKAVSNFVSTYPDIAEDEQMP